MFWKKLFSFFSRPKPEEFEESVFDIQDLDYSYGTTMLYYDNRTGQSYQVSIVCTCDLPVELLMVDESEEIPVLHYGCQHCDRACTIEDCINCKAYDESLKMRLDKETE